MKYENTLFETCQKSFILISEPQRSQMMENVIRRGNSVSSPVSKSPKMEGLSITTFSSSCILK